MEVLGWRHGVGVVPPSTFKGSSRSSSTSFDTSRCLKRSSASMRKASPPLSPSRRLRHTTSTTPSTKRWNAPPKRPQWMASAKAVSCGTPKGRESSLSMVFYSGVQRLDNPTVVVITDRNDLDDQLFGTFAGSRHLLRQDPIQADNRTHLKELLAVASGGVVFTTIQKFSPEEGNVYDTLTERRNVVRGGRRSATAPNTASRQKPLKPKTKTAKSWEPTSNSVLPSTWRRPPQCDVPRIHGNPH